MIRLIIGFGMFVGSTIGSAVPLIWGGSLLSLTSIALSMIGGGIGIWLGYRLCRSLGVL
jgi:hypothetical protein